MNDNRNMLWQLPISYLARQAPPSWLGRHFLLAWHLLILVASWYPFTGWRYTGEGVWAFYAYPIPYYQSGFDNWVNLVAFIPLGYAWGLYFGNRWFAALRAALLAALLAACIEFVQQFLPGRVASNLDILYNVAGALLGGGLAGVFNKLLIVRGWYLRRQRWFRLGGLADYGLVLLVLWFLAQMNPAVPLFGVVVVPGGIPQPWLSPIADARLFLALLETAGVTLHLTAIGLFVLTLLARRQDRRSALLGMVATAFGLKILAAGLLLRPGEFLAWFNLNVLAGLLLATLLLRILVRLKLRWQALGALICLAAIELIEALWPLHAQTPGMSELFRWSYGHLRTFNGLTGFLSGVWPSAAALYLLLLAWISWRRSYQPTIVGR